MINISISIEKWVDELNKNKEYKEEYTNFAVEAIKDLNGKSLELKVDGRIKIV